MSDSVFQSAPSTSTRATPNFSNQAPPLRDGAVDPALVKEVESFLTNRAADPGTNVGRAVAPDPQSSSSVVDIAPSPRSSGVSTALPAAQPAPPPESGSKADQVSGGPTVAVSARADRPVPDVSVATSGAPVEGGPKPEQPVAGPDLPPAAGSGRALPSDRATAPIMAEENDPKISQAARAGLAGQAPGSERP